MTPEETVTDEDERAGDLSADDEEIDLEALAEEVYALLREYLLLEQERGGDLRI